MTSGGDRWSGLLDGLRAAVDMGIGFVHTRVQLFGVELEQELWRGCSLIMWGIAAILLSCLAAGFVGAALIVVFWDSHRELAAICVAAIFVVAASTAFIVVKRSAANRPKPFASTLEVLEHDRDALRSNA